MELDPAIADAIDSVMADHSEQSETFKRRFRNLIELLLTGNIADPDVRRAIELVTVTLEDDD